MTRTSKCRLCNRTIVFDGAKFKVKHFCDDPCGGLRKKQLAKEKNERARQLAADLNGGVSLGKHCKDLADRLRPLVIRTYGEVAAEMGLTSQAVRQIELQALNKIKKLLMPYKNSTSGDAKVRAVTRPIPSLSD